ncbi:MAG: lysophospholipid acyltransferase family protein [Granulosicoccus sp.]
MNARLIRLFARSLSLLPLSLNRSIGATIARIAWVINSRPRHITEINLQLCFPDKSDSEREKLAHQSLLHTGRLLSECAWIWHRPTETTLQLVREIHGETLLRDALTAPRGLILVSPHMGNWEVCTTAVSHATDFTYFYRSPRHRVLEPLLLEWRAHLGGKPASLDASGIRKGLRILKNGGTVGILPDQEPDTDNGVFVPFFHQPALTMTLLSKLAARSKAQVIYTIAERLPGAQGWRIHYLPTDPDIYDDNPDISASAVNRDVERCIALCPEQYVWNYKRFNTTTEGTRRSYRKS